MAKPYLLYKISSGIYYAELLLPDGTRSSKKSTGTRDRVEAEKIVMGWVVNGFVPTNSVSKKNEQTSLDKITFFNHMRTYEFTADEVNKMISILKERRFLISALVDGDPGSVNAVEFLKDFWDYEKSPYVREKKLKGQSIGMHYCKTLWSRINNYWLPRVEGKCLGEITREDISSIFEDPAIQGLAPKTINSILCAMTIPMKWAYYNKLTCINAFDGIIKCANKSNDRKVLDVFTADRLMEEGEWDNDSAKLANKVAMHTGMRAGEIAALRIKDIGQDVIYVNHSWSKYENLKSCKNGEGRKIPIPISHELCEELLLQASFNPYNEGQNAFVFFGLIPGQPTDTKNWAKYLRRALKSIGYEDPDSICFHAWRHYFCTNITRYIKDRRVIKAITGHKTDSMLDHYADHLEKEITLEEAREGINQMFSHENDDDSEPTVLRIIKTA